jgi:LuxR family maltose regulon positive regulatory protein
MTTARSRLIEAGPRKPITVVVTPAGFGKSTLVGDWIRRLESANAVVRFEDDTDGTVRAADLGLALATCVEQLGAPPDAVGQLRAFLSEDRDSLGEEFSRELRTILKALPAPFVIVVEDLHRVSHDSTRMIGSLISQVADPEHRFVITSRVQPPWPLERWRVSGAADLLGAQDLQLDVDDVAAALGHRLGGRAAEVWNATAGWAAAVQVVRWRLKADEPACLGGLVQDMAGYVATEVIPSLPRGDVEILSRLSVLNDFPLDVARAVTGSEATERVLRETIDHTALIALDGDQHFRIHATLNEALRRSLREREPWLERELHRRAGEAWLAHSDRPAAYTNAVEHLLAAEAWQRTLAQLKLTWLSLESTSRLDLLVDWLERIPAECWRDDESLAPLYVVANLRLGRTARALEVIQETAARGHDRVVAATRLGYASTVGWTADPDAAEDLCRRALKTLSGTGARRPESGVVFPGVADYDLAALTSIAQAQAMQGRFPEAIPRFEELIDRAAELSPSALISAHGSLGWCLALDGEISHARHHAASALELASTMDAVNHIRTVPARLANALVAILSGNRDAARPLIEDAARLCRPQGADHLLSCCDMAGAMCGLGPAFGSTGDPEAGGASLRLARQFVAAHLARRDVALDRGATAMIRLRTVGPHPLTLLAWTEVLIAVEGKLAASRWLSAQPEPQSLTARMVRMLADAASTESAGRAAELAGEAAQLAVAADLRGVMIAAPRQLWERETVMARVEPVLLWARQVALAERPADSVFTSRELELLRLLPLGLTMTEMADRLFLAVPTLKWHRANVYRKLDVADRDGAVAKAVELGIVPKVSGL